MDCISYDLWEYRGCRRTKYESQAHQSIGLFTCRFWTNERTPRLPLVASFRFVCWATSKWWMGRTNEVWQSPARTAPRRVMICPTVAKPNFFTHDALQSTNGWISQSCHRLKNWSGKYAFYKFILHFPCHSDCSILFKEAKVVCVYDKSAFVC